jgi:hypothetical protein
MNTTSSSRIRLANHWALAGAALVCAALAHGCASNNGAPDARYPRRAPGCDLAVYHTAVPGVAAWDDIGVAEAHCNIGGAVADCMRSLKAEACRMGGDLLYNVPRTPRRPRYQVMQLIGQVAHTRARGAKGSEDEKPPEKHDDAPPPANAEEAAGPVVPLPSGERPGDPAVDDAPATPVAPPAPAPQKIPAP